MLECVVNISEGRDAAAIAAIGAAAGAALLDLHTDSHHHRSVLTLVGEEAPRAVAAEAVARLDLRHHHGVHPRLGVVDVVPFVPLAGATMADAQQARDAFVRWAATTLGVPCFSYGEGLRSGEGAGHGEERTLPGVRAGAWHELAPDAGPPAPHPSAGAMCVGAREVLVAYNVWLAEPDVPRARQIAREIRCPELRALGLAVGDRAQVSMNLVQPQRLGPTAAYDLVAAHAPVAGAELVGLTPRSVLLAAPSSRWPQLDLAADRTIEARLAGRPLGL